ERLRQPVRVGAVVEAVTALDAQAAFVGRPVAAIDLHDAVVLDVVRHLATDTAIRANRFDLLHAIHSQSAAPTPALDSAPVGQAATHSPQPTQVLSPMGSSMSNRSEEHTSELQSRFEV